MHYLTLVADYSGAMLRDDFGRAVEPVALGLDETLVACMREWNERYRSIIPLDRRAREAPGLVSQIEALDEEGMWLAATIAEALKDEAKVAYYSEGLLRRL